MKTRELTRLGIPRGQPLALAKEALREAAARGVKKRPLRERMHEVADEPERFVDDDLFGELARQLVRHGELRSRWEPRDTPAPYRQWGSDLDDNSIQQMRNACQLPIAVRGALMPDAHLGYGLPIGGVLATRNAVIPYAVGVDIACRMKMSVLDVPPVELERHPERFVKAIEKETRFGIGARFKGGDERREHEVLDEDWSVSPVTDQLRDKAWSQLGTSGSGNHFVEFGTLRIPDDSLGLKPGTYVALLSHSGSRGTGAAVCSHYSRLATDAHPELPDRLRHLAWLDLDSEAGQEYWEAMQLMGKYAAANHACIHRHIADHLGLEALLDLENHHNFAWKETHDGEEVVVHRKGATPAGEGVLGIIPGSMASSTYIARGLGNEDSLSSAAHGAGRVMSRKKAKSSFRWNHVKPLLKERGVRVLSAGLDEVPMVYKDIHAVMRAQSDLVEPVATFEPVLVKMAPAGEPPED